MEQSGGMRTVVFVAMIGVGVNVTRRASKSLDSYFLGGKTMPWWLLGISNASAMWDITGTMWIGVPLLLILGAAIYITSGGKLGGEATRSINYSVPQK